jgi:uncharacterized protein
MSRGTKVKKATSNAKKAKPRARPKTTAARSAAVATEGDVYGAAGGMPFVSGSTLGDRSFSRRAVKELTWADFDRQVHVLARLAYSFKPDAVVGIAHGGVFVGGAVASALKSDFFPVRLTRRSRESQTRAPSGLQDGMPTTLQGKRVLVVDDICSSGDSLEMATQLAKAAGATKVKTAALVTRPDGGPKPHFTAITSQTFFVFPWDYRAVVEDERFDTRKAKKGKAKKKPSKRGLEGGDDVVLGV